MLPDAGTRLVRQASRPLQPHQIDTRRLVNHVNPDARDQEGHSQDNYDYRRPPFRRAAPLRSLSAALARHSRPFGRTADPLVLYLASRPPVLRKTYRAKVIISG